MDDWCDACGAHADVHDDGRCPTMEDAVSRTLYRVKVDGKPITGWVGFKDAIRLATAATATLRASGPTVGRVTFAERKG